MQGESVKEMLYLLEEALEQGAHGVSFGLQYEPGVFAKLDELKAIAQLVKRKDKIITVHMKAYSSLLSCPNGSWREFRKYSTAGSP